MKLEDARRQIARGVSVSAGKTLVNVDERERELYVSELGVSRSWV